LRRGQERDAVFQQQLAPAVDERLLPVAQNVKAHEERAVERAPRRCVGVIGAEYILDAVAKQKFVSNDLLIAVEDRLPGYESKTLQGTRWKRLFRG